MELSRRDLLKYGVLGSAALMLPIERVARTKLLVDRMPESRLPRPYTPGFVRPPEAQPIGRTATTDLYSMDMTQASVEILPGYRTTIWGYDGTTPGPTIRAEQGRRIAIRHCNMLPARHPVEGYKVETSVHLHGSASLPQYDGYASDTTAVNAYKDYHYPNFQDARTLWYHDHGVHFTANNAYMGLAGMYILHSQEERDLGIPQGDYDVPLVIRDAMFGKNGQLLYDDNSHSGVYGDVILVNGRPWPIMDVEPRKYRFRILNGSLSRSYKFQLGGGEPMTVIGGDGGLYPAPQTVGSFRHSPGERYEIVVDFSKYKPGTILKLRNLRPPNNREYDTTGEVMAFRVGDRVTDDRNNQVPSVLNTNTSVMGLEPKPDMKVRNFRFERSGGEWVINDQTWKDVVNSGYKKVVANPKLGDTEIWQFENSSGGWFHPVHVHLVDYKILDRNGQPPMPHERGPKDTLYLGENETVRVIIRFRDDKLPADLPERTGRYMIHCHNLAHEDHDMMVQFAVGDTGDDPREADPSKPMPDSRDELPPVEEGKC